MDDKEVPCSYNPLFTSTELEFVSVYQLVKDIKISNDSNAYEDIIKQATNYGLAEQKVREHYYAQTCQVVEGKRMADLFEVNKMKENE